MQPNRPRQPNYRRTNNKNKTPKSLRRAPSRPVPGAPTFSRTTSNRPNMNVLLRLPIRNTLIIRKFSRTPSQLPPVVTHHLIIIAVNNTVPFVTTQIAIENGVLQIKEISIAASPEQAPSTPAVILQPNQQLSQQPTIQPNAEPNSENSVAVPNVLTNDQPHVETNAQFDASPNAPNNEQSDLLVVAQPQPQAVSQTHAEAYPPSLSIFDDDAPVNQHNNGDTFNTLLKLIDEGSFFDVIGCPVPDCDKFGAPSALDNHYILTHCNEFVTDKNIFDNDFDLEKFLRGEN